MKEIHKSVTEACRYAGKAIISSQLGMQRRPRSGVSRKPVGSGETTRPSEEFHIESALENPYPNAVRSPRSMADQRQSSSSDQFYDVESPASYQSQAYGAYLPMEDKASYEHLQMPTIRAVRSAQDSLQRKFSNGQPRQSPNPSSNDLFRHSNISQEYYNAPQGIPEYYTNQESFGQYPEDYPPHVMGHAPAQYVQAYPNEYPPTELQPDMMYGAYYPTTYQQYPSGPPVAHAGAPTDDAYDNSKKYGYIYDSYSQGDDAYPVAADEIYSKGAAPSTSTLGRKSSVGDTEDGTASVLLEPSASEQSVALPRELQPSPTLESLQSSSKLSPPPSQHNIESKSSLNTTATNDSDAAIGVGTGSEYVRKLRIGAAETTAPKRPTRLPIGINASMTKARLRAPPEFLSKAMDIRYMHLQPRMLASEVDDDDIGPTHSSPAQTNASSQTTERDAKQPESPSESVIEDMGKIKLFVANPDDD